MRYGKFVPRLYNLCRSLDYTPGKIMPARAFCADENQGYPIIQLTKHFGTFLFNHGRAGGIMATDRHRPHAHHGKDLLILQASHVGYDPETGEFGITANYIQPGGIMTPESRDTFRKNPGLRDFCIKASAARRLGEPVDVAKVALFLASDDAVFVSGTGIAVDGGRAAD